MIHKMKKDQNGFSPIVIVLIFAIIAIIAMVGWRVTSRKTPAAKNGPTSQSQTTNNDTRKTLQLPDNWKWFESVDKSVKFGYPSTWGTLTEQTQAESEQSFDTNNFIQPLVITDKDDLLIQIPKGFVDYMWYFWDKTLDDGLISAKDQKPPADNQLANYSKPNDLGRVGRGPTESFLAFKDEANKHAVYKVLGKGAMNCGVYHYFFEINNKIVHLQASLCDRGGELQPGTGQTFTDVVEDPLRDTFLYID